MSLFRVEESCITLSLVIPSYFRIHTERLHRAAPNKSTFHSFTQNLQIIWIFRTFLTVVSLSRLTVEEKARFLNITPCRRQKRRSHRTGWAFRGCTRYKVWLERRLACTARELDGCSIDRISRRRPRKRVGCSRGCILPPKKRKRSITDPWLYTPLRAHISYLSVKIDPDVILIS